MMAAKRPEGLQHGANILTELAEAAAVKQDEHLAVIPASHLREIITLTKTV